MSKFYYQYDEKTLAYIGEVIADIDQLKTVALKKTVYLGPPRFATENKPSKVIGECWFVDGKWTTTNPNPSPAIKKKESIPLVKSVGKNAATAKKRKNDETR